MKIDLAGRSAVVTGGSRGIGRAIALLLARSGAQVTLGYRSDGAAARRVVRAIERAGGRAQAVQADLARPSGAERVIAAATRRFRGPDILVNNAGIWKGASLVRMTDADWEETLRLNLTGAFRACRSAVRRMKRRGYGRIVNIASTAGQRGEAGHSHYAASKGGLISLTKSLAAELAECGITVNAVAPGWVDTDMSAHTLRGSRRREIQAAIPLGRAARPEEIAAPVVFLCSDASSFITGEIVNVNGGAVLCG